MAHERTGIVASGGRGGRLSDRARALADRKAVAVVRLPDAAAAEAVADALLAGGVTAIEITLTTAGAERAIRTLAERPSGGLLVGAGSVTTAEQAARVIDAGAAFVVSPILAPAVAERARAAAVPAVLGGYSPTELHAAREAGADIVKVFPADGLGPSYIRGVLGPMPGLPLMPTGGVTPENAGDWLRAGAVAVGVGGALVNAKAVAAGDFDAITEAARTLARSCRDAGASA